MYACVFVKFGCSFFSANEMKQLFVPISFPVHTYVDSIKLKQKQNAISSTVICVSVQLYPKLVILSRMKWFNMQLFFSALNTSIYFLILYLLPFRLCLIIDIIYSICLSFNAKFCIIETCVKGHGYLQYRNMQIIFFVYLKVHYKNMAICK